MPDAPTLTPDPLAMLAPLFEPPDDAYLGRLEALVEALRDVQPVAGRQLADLLGRLDGLSEAELRELYAQTFDSTPGTSPSIVQAVARLRFVEGDVRPGYVSRVVAPALERDLARLGAQRNPFIHLLKATLCVLPPVAGDALGTPG